MIGQRGATGWIGSSPLMGSAHVGRSTFTMSSRRRPGSILGLFIVHSRLTDLRMDSGLRRNNTEIVAAAPELNSPRRREGWMGGSRSEDLPWASLGRGDIGGMPLVERPRVARVAGALSGKVGTGFPVRSATNGKTRWPGIRGEVRCCRGPLLRCRQKLLRRYRG